MQGKKRVLLNSGMIYDAEIFEVECFKGVIVWGVCFFPNNVFVINKCSPKFKPEKLLLRIKNPNKKQQ